VNQKLRFERPDSGDRLRFEDPNSMRDAQERLALPTATSIWQRPIPVAAIILLALAIHGPLLVMELPATTSYDANSAHFFCRRIMPITGSIPGMKSGLAASRKLPIRL